MKKFNVGDTVIIRDINAIMYGEKYFAQDVPLRVMAVDEDGDLRLEMPRSKYQGFAFMFDGVPTFLLTEDEFHALELVEEDAE